jgi:hypothetical protein
MPLGSQAKLLRVLQEKKIYRVGGLRPLDVEGVYGFSVRTGPGGSEVKVEPFGNIKRDEKSGKTVVEEFREPVVDIFEEEDHILVVA